MAQHDWLTSLVIRGDERRKSREWAHLANAGDFRSRRSAKIAIAAPGTLGDYRRSPRSAYKIAKCVAGLSDPAHLG